MCDRRIEYKGQIRAFVWDGGGGFERKDSEGRGGHPHSGLKRWAQLRADELLNASAADQFRKAIVLPQLAPGGLT